MDGQMDSWTDGQTDGQTWLNGQMNESDFIGRCPTNVKRPKKKKKKSVKFCIVMKSLNS